MSCRRSQPYQRTSREPTTPPRCSRIPRAVFLYGSNRGHHSIAVFAVDSDKGTLTPVEHVSTQGEWPRNFRIDPTGRYLFAANQNTDNVVVFRIDEETGRLSPTGQVLEIDSPVCVRFVALD